MTFSRYPSYSSIVSSPGRIGLVSIHGETGKLIEFGQWLNGDGFTAHEHSFIDLGDGSLIEAEPGGARIRPLSKYDGVDVYWCDNLYRQVSLDKLNLVAQEAWRLQGTPYSFADYAALVAHRLGVPSRHLKDYIADSGHLICSQLCDLAYQRAGFQLFSDGRWPGYVTPGDLYQLDSRTSVWETVGWDNQWDFP